MALDPVKNFFEAEVTSTILSGSTTFTVGSGVASSFIDPTTYGAYNLVVFNSTDYPSPDSDPYAVFLRVTGVNTGTETITIEQPSAGNSYNGEGDSNIARDLNIAGKTYTVQRVASKNDWDKIQTELNGKQATIGYTTENAANKKTTITESDTDYPTGQAVHTALAGKEATIGYTTENAANKKTSLTDNSDTYYPTQKAVKTAVDLKQDALGYTAENAANKSTSVSTDGTSDTKYPSVKAVKTYADGLVAGAIKYRGAYDASVNTYPETGGSGTSGAVMQGDMWIVSVAGTLGGEAVQVGDSIIANTDTPAQVAANWNHLNANVSYVPEDVANKETTALDTSTTKYPCNNVVKDGLDAKQNTMTKTVYTDIDTGTDDDKYVTSKSLGESGYNKLGGITTSSASPTPNFGRRVNEYFVTALAVDATFASPEMSFTGGALRDGDSLLIRIKDNGTARTLAWNAIYRVIGTTLPTTTVANKTIYIGCKYNSGASKWDVLAVGQEA